MPETFLRYSSCLFTANGAEFRTASPSPRTTSGLNAERTLWIVQRPKLFLTDLEFKTSPA